MNDSELIYLYIIENNEMAFNYLYKKYENKSEILLRKILANFFSIPLEINDLKSNFYFIFCESIYKFCSNKNKSFKNFLYSEVKWGMLTYFKRFLNNNHKIINCALSYNDGLVTKPNYQVDNSFLKDIIMEAQLTYQEQQVLKLKQNGYTMQEIIKKLNLTYKQVDNTWTRTKTKVKKCYKKYLQ